MIVWQLALELMKHRHVNRRKIQMLVGMGSIGGNMGDEIVVESRGPYRTSATVVKTNPDTYYGVMVAPPSPPVHVCNPPGFWARTYRFFIGKPIRIDSIFRCSGCGNFYILYASGWCTNDGQTELKKRWLALGGKIE